MITTKKDREWTYYLPHTGVLERLSECRSTKADLKYLIKARYIWRKNKNVETEIEDVVVEMLEWVGDWNGQWMLTDNLTEDEYKELIKFCK